MTTENRLARVERELRRWRMAGLAATLVAVAAVAMGAKAGSPDLECRSLTVVDEQGRGRIRMGCMKDGTAAIILTDETGKSPILSLGVSKRDAPTLFMCRPGDMGNFSVAIGAEDKHGGVIELHDTDGKSTVLGVPDRDE